MTSVKLNLYTELPEFRVIIVVSYLATCAALMVQ
jgi:hypothetical protein